MTQLDEKTYNGIATLVSKGNALSAELRYDDAIQAFQEALELLPTPYTKWESATWLYMAMGDIYFLRFKFEKTRECFMNALQSPGGQINPFIHLRLGQACLELGDLEKAEAELKTAYRGGALQVLLEENPKYLAFLKTKMQL